MRRKGIPTEPKFASEVPNLRESQNRSKLQGAEDFKLENPSHNMTLQNNIWKYFVHKTIKKVEDH